MRNTQNIIGQHYKSVAQSFLKYGYTGQVNPHTLEAMITMHGKPFLNHLSMLIQKQSRYDGMTGALGAVKETLQYDIQPWDDYNNGGDQGLIKDPNQYIAPPFIPVPPSYEYPNDGPGGVKLPPVSLQGNGGLVEITKQVEPVVLLNQELPMNSLPPDTMPTLNPTNIMEQEKTFWEKYSTAIIIVLIILVLLFLKGRSNPVIIK